MSTIGDKLARDRDRLAGELSPIGTAWGYSGCICDELMNIQRLAEQLVREIAALEAEGVYDSEPTPSWEQRDGSGAYLRLVYRTEQATGQRRKEYVGNNKEKVEAALARLDRTKQHRRLKARLTSLLAHVRQVNEGLREAGRQLTRAADLWGRDLHSGGQVLTPNEKVR